MHEFLISVSYWQRHLSVICIQSRSLAEKVNMYMCTPYTYKTERKTTVVLNTPYLNVDGSITIPASWHSSYNSSSSRVRILRLVNCTPIEWLILLDMLANLKKNIIYSTTSKSKTINTVSGNSKLSVFSFPFSDWIPIDKQKREKEKSRWRVRSITSRWQNFFGF